MSFDSELLSMAVIGTENEQADDAATRLLYQAGKQCLQKRAGYLPINTEADLPLPVFTYPKRLLGTLAQEYLAKLVDNRDQYFVFPEWCLMAANLNLALPPEWIPTLLNVGSSTDALRPYLILLMDTRAYFLAEQSQPELHWDWILQQVLFSQEELEANSEREGLNIMRSFDLAQERDDFNLGMMSMVRLSSIKPPWNIWLADSFMSFMRRSIYQGQLTSIFASPFLERLAKYLPLEYAENFIVIIDNGLEDSKWWQTKRAVMRKVFEFRRNLIASLEPSLDEF